MDMRYWGLPVMPADKARENFVARASRIFGDSERCHRYRHQFPSRRQLDHQVPNARNLISTRACAPAHFAIRHGFDRLASSNLSID